VQTSLNDEERCHFSVRVKRLHRSKSELESKSSSGQKIVFQLLFTQVNLLIQAICSASFLTKC